MITASASEEDRTKYHNYRNYYNKPKITYRNDYYSSKCVEYITKRLWEMMNNIIGKMKHLRRIIPYITVNGIKTYDSIKIANEFGEFDSCLGADLADKIPNSKKLIDYYVSKIPRTSNSLVVRGTNCKEIEKIIKDLPMKTSSGHDHISNVVLKALNESISYPLSIIFNQSISTGKFPEMMKIAEIVPLYKGEEDDLVIN